METLYLTLLDIKDSLTPDAFLKLVLSSVKTSSRPENDIPAAPSPAAWNGTRDFTFRSATCVLESRWHEDIDTITVRFTKNEETHRHWYTEYTVNFTMKKMLISLKRDYDDPARKKQPYSAPHFVTLLAQGGYLKDDGIFPVTRSPLTLSEEVATISSLEGKTLSHELPVLLILPQANGRALFSAEDIGHQVKGLAHVVVPQDPEAVRAAMSVKRKHPGDMVLYLPSHEIVSYAVPRPLFLHKTRRDIINSQALSDIYDWAKNRHVDTLYTWEGVTGAELEDLQAMDRSQKTHEAADYQALEDLNASLLKENEDLTRKAASLEGEVASLKARLKEKDAADEEAQGFFLKSHEHDLFTDEREEIILTILKEALDNLPLADRKGSNHTRRADLLEDIVRSNDWDAVAKKRSRREEDVKRVVTGYQTMTASVEKSLESLGFTVEKGTKHYKILYHGDSRYVLTTSNSGSDRREGLNVATDMIRRFLH